MVKKSAEKLNLCFSAICSVPRSLSVRDFCLFPGRYYILSSSTFIFGRGKAEVTH